MEYTFMEIAWLFFIYSFIGWILEVCIAAIQRKKFINRGFVNIPLCPIYGFGAVLFAIFLPELSDNLFFLFIGGTVLATVLEFCTGIFMEKIFHRKLWNYSNLKWNLDGYICLRFSTIWGLLSILLIRYTNPGLCKLVNKIPYPVAIIVLWTLTALLILDFIGTSMTVLNMLKTGSRMAQISEGIQQTSKFLENALTNKIQSRMMNSFPSIDMETIIKNAIAKKERKEQPKVFAYGCSFYKLLCLFFIGAFLGDITETIFCFITTGVLMSRSSVVYGDFSIVWGLACALLTALLYRYKDKDKWHLFWAGVILGGAYEYICSMFTELVFGTVFWDYSGFLFNLGGRINLLYCFFWGIAAVVWFKYIYPIFSKLIEKIPVLPGKILCNIVMIFMIFNMLISSLALARYTERNVNSMPAAENALQEFLDDHFPDDRMEAIYPNAKIVDEPK